MKILLLLGVLASAYALPLQISNDVEDLGVKEIIIKLGNETDLKIVVPDHISKMENAFFWRFGKAVIMRAWARKSITLEQRDAALAKLKKELDDVTDKLSDSELKKIMLYEGEPISNTHINVKVGNKTILVLDVPDKLGKIGAAVIYKIGCTMINAQVWWGQITKEEAEEAKKVLKKEIEKLIVKPDYDSISNKVIIIKLGNATDLKITVPDHISKSENAFFWRFGKATIMREWARKSITLEQRDAALAKLKKELDDITDKLSDSNISTKIINDSMPNKEIIIKLGNATDLKITVPDHISKMENAFFWRFGKAVIMREWARKSITSEQRDAALAKLKKELDEITDKLDEFELKTLALFEGPFIIFADITIKIGNKSQLVIHVPDHLTRAQADFMFKMGKNMIEAGVERGSITREEADAAEKQLKEKLDKLVDKDIKIDLQHIFAKIVIKIGNKSQLIFHVPDRMCKMQAAFMYDMGKQLIENQFKNGVITREEADKAEKELKEQIDKLVVPDTSNKEVTNKMITIHVNKRVQIGVMVPEHINKEQAESVFKMGKAEIESFVQYGMASKEEAEEAEKKLKQALEKLM